MLYEKYYDEVIRFCEDNRENLIADIKRLVDIPSVEGTPEPGKPFGPGPAAALAEVLKMADEMGFDTHNCENYMGWAELKGKSDKQIATVTHVDVVPAGNGWTGDPFNMVVKNGWIIGRGAIDDKGPAVSCLYILKFLKEHNIPLNYTVRTLMGANEETGMGDVDYYLAHNKAPDFCFSPDAMFPVCNGEKGGLKGEVVSGVLGGNILEFDGGLATNMVPDRATCLVKGEFSKLSEQEGITLAEENGATRITGFGKGGPASKPAGTVNAIELVVNYLLDNHLGDEKETEFLEFLRLMHSNPDGSPLHIDAKDEAFDPLTIVGSVIHLEDGQLHQRFDCRYPTSITGDQIQERILAASKGCAHLEGIKDNKPFYCSPDMPVIQALMKTFNDVTGQNAEPFTMGGGTYARHFPLAVSFGPEYLDATLPDFVGPYHGPDEGAEIQTLVDALKMYILSVLRLLEIEL